MPGKDPFRRARFGPVVAAVTLVVVGGLLSARPTVAAGTPPTVDDQVLSTAPGAPLPITLVGHDPEGGGALGFVASDPANGVVAPSAGSMTCVDDAGTSDCTAAVTYTPDGGFHGADSFTFSVIDAEMETSTPGTVTIEVNSPPVAADDPGVLCQSPSQFGGSFPIPEDFPDPFLFFGSCALLANDADPDGDALTISVVTPPAHGWYEAVNAGGIDLAYTPDPDYSTLAGDQPGGDWVSDSLTYVATDGVADSNEATMRFWIAPVNDPPTFTPGPLVIEVDEDSGAYSAGWATVIAPGPANESGQAVHFEVVDLDVIGVPNLFAVDPAIDASGVLTFTTGADEYGLAFVTVQAVDDGGLEDWGVTYAGLPVPDDTSDPVQFAIVVGSVNDAPVALDDSVATDEDTPLEFDLVATDDNGGTVGVLPDDPGHGTLEALGSAGVSCVGTVCTRTVIYTPDPDYTGLDSFTFHADDGDLQSGPATVTVTVGAINDPPAFTAGTDPEVDEDGGAYAGGWASGISAGPADEAGQAVSFQVIANDHAELFSVAPAVAANGTLTFTPAANRHGVAHLSVVAVDDGGTANGGLDTSAESTLTITVNDVNDPPNAVNDTGLAVAEHAPGTVLDVLANDSSLPDGPETLTIVWVSQGAHGTVTISGGGTTVTYTPDPAFHGTDVFDYGIEDPGGLGDDATVVVTVEADATPPTTSAPAQSIRAGLTMARHNVAGRVSWTGSDAGVGIGRYELQRSTDGGSYRAVGLSGATVTHANVSFEFGRSYRFRVRAVDRNGNVSAWKYGPTFSTGRSQETSGYITYAGAWSRVRNTNDSAKHARTTQTAGRSATYTRSIRDVALVAPKSSSRGSVRIFVDGNLVATVSLKASSKHFRQVLWSTHFASPASHAIRVVVVGNGRVDIDCFVALV